MKRVSAAFIGLSLVVCGSGAGAQETWALLPDQASCLMANLETYQQAETAPIVIFVQVCPVVDRLEALQALQQNSGSLPSVTVTDEGRPLDEVIVYTSEELACLGALELDLSATPVLLPQKPCRVQP